MRAGLALGLTLWLTAPCYAGAPTFSSGSEPSAVERVALALCVAVHVAALVESCWTGQRWYRPFAMVAAYAAVVGVWLGDRFDSPEDVWVLLVVAGGVWAASDALAAPVRRRARWKAAGGAGAGAAVLCAVTDSTRGGFLTSELWAAGGVLLVWIAGLLWVVIRRLRG